MKNTVAFSDLQSEVGVRGHVTIKDDLGNILLDEDNAVHPINMARVFARALARENNCFVNRIAFGNGGTIVDAAQQITYNTPNDGLSPDTAGWRSRLYHETYSEFIDDSSLLIGSGLGSSSTNDPITTPSSGPGVRSSEDGLISSITITSVLNPYEPQGQTTTDTLSPTESTEDAFVFDEIGLFTGGTSLVSTAGYQDINVGTRIGTDITGLAQNAIYTFNITVDGGVTQTVTFNTGIGTGVGGEITFNDLVSSLNMYMVGATASISNASGSINTFGKLRIASNSVGTSSSITIEIPTIQTANWLFSSISGYTTIDQTVAGTNEGLQNNVTDPTSEGERLLTHLIFSPVRKSANRTLTILYTLTIQVARSSY